MTYRRRVLKIALAAPAAALAAAGARVGRLAGGDAALFDLYADWLALAERMNANLLALEAAERRATARGVRWSAYPAVRAAREREAAAYDDERRTVFAAAATPATGLDGLAVKLALWRRANTDVLHGQCTDNCDRLVFSAYDDVIAMAGRDDLAHEGDKALLLAVRRG